MVKKLKVGNVINGYDVTQCFDPGAMALSYAANSSTGEKVFLKQYKSPSVTVEWYRGYVDYQQELKRRVESTAAQRVTYRFVDFFEAVWGASCYFQVFEFVEEGHDLKKVLDELHENPSAYSWDQRLMFAKVIMGSINMLHGAGIIHCDLKPENIQLFKDDTIAAGYVVKMIDMDYSILNDRQAPWHGHQNYIGTPGYLSTEHMTSGGVPMAASDVFTCGLILYELLAERHPYRSDTPEEYQKAVLAHTASYPKLAGPMSAPANDADVTEALHRCLAPDPAHRPSAKDIVLVLNGRPKPSDRRSPGPSDPKPKPDTAPPPHPEPPTTLAQELALEGDTGQSVKMRVRTPVGKYLLQAFGTDAVYYHAEQFVLERGDDDKWYANHNPEAKHQTLLNGKSITDKNPVNDGDVLAVGSEERGIQKLPVTVRLL